MGDSLSLAKRRIHETPFAVIDFETTGLTPGYDRVIEIAVVRVDPGESPKLVFDTLVNPQRSVAATEIHGITDTDVADAPLFRDIVGDIVDAISGCVVAAYNVYFDIKFLSYELRLIGLDDVPPHVCLMYFRPLLGLGCRCRLEEACRAHGIAYNAAHVAAEDGQASSQLLQIYLHVLRTRGVSTFQELATLGSYKFLSSLRKNSVVEAARFHLRPCGRRKSRCVDTPLRDADSDVVAETRAGIRAYWDALKAAVADLQITAEEFAKVRQVREDYGLTTEQLRALHARAYASVIAQFVDDQCLDDREVTKLRKFHQCLSQLGWAPGE